MLCRVICDLNVCYYFSTMHSITQKLRNVFSWQHDTYEFESYQAVTATSSENMQTNQDQSATAVPKKGKLFKPKVRCNGKVVDGAEVI